MSLLDRIPDSFKVLAFVAIPLAPPTTVIAFLGLGLYYGLGAVLFWIFFFLVLYMLAVRKYGGPQA